MSDEDDLRINRAHRYRKHSPRLVLEEHSHCEVPAGCGGVVLRWRDPQAGLPLIVSIVTPGAAEIWVDGEAQRGNWLVIQPGVRHLALRVHELEEGPHPLMLSVAHYDERNEQESAPLTLSRLDPTWRATSTAPPEGWTEPDFDDTGWEPVTSGESLTGAHPDWWFRRLRERGAIALRVTGPETWLRTRFRVVAP